MKLHRSLAWVVALALVLSSASVAAFDDDEMTFEPDEVQMDDDDDDAMTFAPDDVDDDEFDPEADEDDALDVGVVTVPADDITDAERQEIQSAVRDAAREIPGINTYGESDLLPGLIDRDPEYCSRESLCLASIGRSAGVDRILQARVEEQGGDYRLDIDYFDVENRLFAAYHTSTGLGDIDDLIEAVPAGVDDIFGIRRGPLEDDFVDVDEVNAMRIASYVAGGASVLSLGIGTIFGLRVSSAQSELDDRARDEDGRYLDDDFTQREARRHRRDMESNASIANFGIGAGIGFAATSVLLFILSSEDDPAVQDADQAAAGSGSSSGVEIAPRWGDDGLGVGATWRF